MNTSTEINLALREFSAGNKKGAYLKLKKIFKKNKEDEKLRFNIAVIEQSLNLNEEAKLNYKFLIKNSLNIKAMTNLYQIYIKEDNFIEALNLINKILENNNFQDTVKDKAFVLYKLNKFDESIKICKNFLLTNNDVFFMNIIGLNCFAKNEFDKAELIFKKALLIDKNNPILLNSLGRFYHERRDSKNAEKYLLKAFEIKRDSYEIINNLAGFYREEANYEKSIELYNKALIINPNNPAIINNLAKVYFDIDNLKLAKKYCLEALSLNKEDGNIQKILSLIYIRENNYKDGWPLFDGRLKLSDFAEKNNSLDKIRNKLVYNNRLGKNSKLLILREQGIGDEILYGTMYPDLLKYFKDVSIECDSRLKNIFKKSFPKYENSFVDLGMISQNEEALKEYDYVMYAGSLGRFYRNNINDFSNGCYLEVDSKIYKEINNDLKNLKEKFNVGISWKSFKNRYALEKSLILEDLNKIFNTKNCNFINLQYGNVEDEIKKFNSNNNKKLISIKNIDLFNDFDKLAALLKNLDLFISVSNSTAHLAGSLGVKTLLIKPKNHAIFHYWNQSSNKSPWYESIELINREDIFNKKDLVSKFLNY